MTATGPQARPEVVATKSPFGRILPKEKPTPPPFFLRIEDSLTTSKIPSTLSGIGKTKQLANWLLTVPALASVLPPGKKRISAINLKNFLAHDRGLFFSAVASALATLSNICLGVSILLPSSLFCKYLLAMITNWL